MSKPWKLETFTNDDDYGNDAPTGIRIVDGHDQEVADNQRYYPTAIQPYHADKIICCVNACDDAGLSNEFLNSGGLKRLVGFVKKCQNGATDVETFADSKALIVEITK